MNSYEDMIANCVSQDDAMAIKCEPETLKCEVTSRYNSVIDNDLNTQDIVDMDEVSKKMNSYQVAAVITDCGDFNDQVNVKCEPVEIKCEVEDYPEESFIQYDTVIKDERVIGSEDSEVKVEGLPLTELKQENDILGTKDRQDADNHSDNVYMVNTAAVSWNIIKGNMHEELSVYSGGNDTEYKMEEHELINIEEYNGAQEQREMEYYVYGGASPAVFLEEQLPADPYPMGLENQQPTDVTYGCDECDKIFDKRDYLKKHKDCVHLQIRRHTCEECGKKFKQSAHLKRHMEGVHRRRPHQCDLCSKSFSQMNLLKSHKLSVHGGHRPFLCTTCGKRFSRAEVLRHHDDIVHKKLRPFSCPECKKGFGKSWQLKLHVETVHQGLKPHECADCGKKFSHLGGLKGHKERIHSGVRVYRCDLCGEKFDQKPTLKEHKENVHQVPSRFACEVCGKTFSQKGYMKIHMKSEHEGEYAHRCKECGRGFNLAVTLKRHHELVHLRIKRYECAVCNKKFGTKSHMKDHIESKHDNVTHECEKCQKKFNSFKSLQRHLLTHKPKPKKMNCRRCGKVFKRKAFLRKHKSICPRSNPPKVTLVPI